jgi:hypothetical protein
MRIAPLPGDSPLPGLTTGQPSEFGSNHDQRKSLVLAATHQCQCKRLQVEPADSFGVLEIQVMGDPGHGARYSAPGIRDGIGPICLR